MFIRWESRHKKAVQYSVAIFIACFCVGLGLSLRKPLWNDESYSQSENIEQFSYREIFLGQIEKEGNKSPLFYLIQKAFCEVIGYEFPYAWERQWLIRDIPSQILLRLNPNFFMSLSLALIFFYFAYTESLFSGFYALFVSLSFFMVWFYWVDARPYALWFFLSTLQLLLFLILLRPKQEVCDKYFYRGLFLTNVLMAFTISIGVAQIAIVSGFLWLLKERNFKKHLLITVVPIAIGLPYYFFIPKGLTQYFPLPQPMALLYACVSKPWLIFFGISVLIIILTLAAPKFSSGSLRGPSETNRNLFFLPMTLAGLLLFMYLAAFLLLATLMARIVPSEQAVHYIHERYFLFLVPPAIIGINIFSHYLWKLFRNNPWMLFNTVLGLGGLLGLAYLDTWIRLVAKHLYF